MKAKEIAERLGLKDSIIRPLENLTAEKEEKEEMKDLKTEVTVRKKRNWKKIALISVGALAAVGGVAALIIKAKNGDVPCLEAVDYIVDDNGCRFEMSSLFNKNGDVAQLAFNDITAKEVYNAVDYLNPDTWGVSADQFKWDEVIFIKN